MPMPSRSDIARPFVKATRDVLSAMAGISAFSGRPYIKRASVAAGDVSAVVSVTGDRTGSIAVSFTLPCAVAMVKGILGENVRYSLKNVQDAAEEVSNRISVQGRAGLRELGLVLHGSTPTVIVGHDHSIRHSSHSPVIAIPFTTAEGEFTVEFCLESSSKR